LGVFPVFVILGYRLAFDTFLTAAARLDFHLN